MMVYVIIVYIIMVYGIACVKAYAIIWNIYARFPRICLRDAPARILAKTYYSGPGRSLALVVVVRGRYRR